MDKKTTGIVSYITPIGWIIAFCAGDKEGAKFHLNQSLVYFITCIVLSIVLRIFGIFMPGVVMTILNLVVSIFELVLFILGLVAACKDEEKELPLIGQIKILK